MIRYNILIRFFITLISVGGAAYLIEGIYIDSVTALIISSIVLGLINAFIRPVFIILTLPITILTLGLFLFLINGIMLVLAAALVPGFHIQSVWAAVLGWIIISIIGWVSSKLFPDKGV